MIKSKYYKLIMSMACVSLFGCGSGGGSSILASDFIAADKTEVIDEPVESITDTEISKEYSSLEVDWDDLADNEDGFLIERSTDGTDEFVVLTSVDTDKTSYIDTLAEIGRTYCYRIGAYNENGISYSDILCNNNT